MQVRIKPVFPALLILLHSAFSYAQPTVLPMPAAYEIQAPGNQPAPRPELQGMPLPGSLTGAVVPGSGAVSGAQSSAAPFDTSTAPLEDFLELPFERPRGAWRQDGKIASLVPSSNTVLTANFAVEADYSVYQFFGNNEAAVRTYVNNLFLAVSSIYEADIKVKIQPSVVRVWTKPDPWSSLTTTLSVLKGVSPYWGKHHKTVPRAGVVVLSMRNLGGGIAYLNTLCNENAMDATSNYAYGVAVAGNLRGVISTVPGANTWDVVVVAHELGHNFNSGHTHCTKRVNSVGFYDQCYATATPTTCFAGPAVAGNGTIMSYCHAGPGTIGMAAINPMHFVDATADPAHTNVMRASAEEYTVGNNPQGCLIPN